MNDIVKAIEYLKSQIISEEDIKILLAISDTYKKDCKKIKKINYCTNLAIQALQEKVEREKIRCANCEYGCPADYGICSCSAHKMSDTDYDTYCSYFILKESEEKE